MATQYLIFASKSGMGEDDDFLHLPILRIYGNSCKLFASETCKELSQECVQL